MLVFFIFLLFFILLISRHFQKFQKKQMLIYTERLPVKKSSPVVAKKKEISSPKVEVGKQKEKRSLPPDSLDKIAKNLSSVLDSAPIQSSEPLFTPTLLSSQNTATPAPYAQAVMQILSNELQLPEFGEVLIHIEISSTGKVLTVEILQTESTKNSAFLKNQLPELSFPCFNEFALHENKMEFTIAFRNAENF